MEQGLLFKQPTYYEEVERKGYTRRDFMRFASLMEKDDWMCALTKVCLYIHTCILVNI